MRSPLLTPIIAPLALLPSWCAAGSTAPVAAGQALQVVLGLAVVLGMIVLAAWAARRLQAIRPQGNGHIRIIEGLALGTRDKLLLVEIDGRRVLLGLSPGRIATLHSFTGEAAPVFDDVLRAAGQQRASESS
jgi:flagellar protein FliO/FliZ